MGRRAGYGLRESGMNVPPDAPYPIMAIDADCVTAEEDMGSKRKFWFQASEDDPHWLFKYPQANTGQHWAEKIAAELADAMNVLHAPVELAVFGDTLGSATESFIVADNRELVHGNQVLAGQLLDYDPDKRFRQSDHTLENIFAALERVFIAPDDVRRAKRQMAEYLILDAVIGNTDRHHENWGILRSPGSDGEPEAVAPTFDHASSLGRELLDESEGKSRRRYLEEGTIPRYAERARGAIYWESDDRRGISPLNLVRCGSARYPECFQAALARMDNFQEQMLGGIVERVPEAWMSETARTFAVALMRYNLEQIKSISV